MSGNASNHIWVVDSTKATGGYWTRARGSAQGAMHISGLARNAVRVSTGAYSTTEILGFRILVAGTGTLTLSPVGGADDIVITAAEITAMGVNAFVDFPMHLDSITLGNADMEVLVYTP